MRVFQHISHGDQTIRVGEPQRAQQYALDDRKNRRRRSDAQPQHQDSRHGKSGRLTELAEGISGVLQNPAQSLKPSLVAMQLLRLFHASVGDSCGSSCLFRGHTLAQIFVFQQRQMRGYFSCQVTLHFGAGEKQIKP